MQKLRSGMTVPAICEAAGVSKQTTQLVEVAPDARTFVETLAQNQAFADAIAFLAHALPRREGVWWAWLCARDSVGAKPAPPVAASLEATKAWIAEPTDGHRRAALGAAESAGIATPVGLAALAAFLCGDTLGPAEAPPAPPPEFAAAKAIVGCVNLAAVADEEADVGERYAELVRRGVELADRINLWTPEASATPTKGRGT